MESAIEIAGECKDTYTYMEHMFRQCTNNGATADTISVIEIIMQYVKRLKEGIEGLLKISLDDETGRSKFIEKLDSIVKRSQLNRDSAKDLLENGNAEERIKCVENGCKQFSYCVEALQHVQLELKNMVAQMTKSVPITPLSLRAPPQSDPNLVHEASASISPPPAPFQEEKNDVGLNEGFVQEDIVIDKTETVSMNNNQRPMAEEKVVGPTDSTEIMKKNGHEEMEVDENMEGGTDGVDDGNTEDPESDSDEAEDSDEEENGEEDEEEEDHEEVDDGREEEEGSTQEKTTKKGLAATKKKTRRSEYTKARKSKRVYTNAKIFKPDVPYLQQFANTEPSKELQDLVDELPEEKKEFHIRLQMQKVGSRAFVVAFENGEALHFKNGKIHFFFCENENDFEKRRKVFSKEIFLIDQLDANCVNGMKVPNNVTFENILEKIKTKEMNKMKFKVINSRAPSIKMNLTISKFLGEIKKERFSGAWNLLSFEFTKLNIPFDKEFSLPELVKSQSMVLRLEHALNEKLREVAKLLRKDPSNAELLSRKSKIEEQIKEMPQYHKFLLISTAGSFTDAHVDFGGTAVYYHPFVGRKIFYLAPPSKENLEVFRRYEENKDLTWIGLTLHNQWERLEIKAGNTAIIPPGYIHFVYTPEDSIVVGGNFLLIDHLETIFDTNRFDEKSVDDGRVELDNIFQNCRNVLYSYVQNVFLDELRSLQSVEGDLSYYEKIATQFYENLSPLDENANATWYNDDEKKAMMRELEKFISEFKKLPRKQQKCPRKRENRTPIGNTVGEPSSKYDGQGCSSSSATTEGPSSSSSSQSTQNIDIEMH